MTILVQQQPTQISPENDNMFFGATYNELLCAAIGGFLMCIASSLYLWTKGRITGMSGIINSIITLEYSTLHWKISMLLGIIITSSATLLFFNDGYKLIDDLSTFQNGLSVFGFALTGFLIGSGAKLANGCTSGHGVCGVPRFSKRSLVAISCFMLTTFLTANLMQYFREQNELEFITQTSQLKQTFSDKEGNRLETEFVFYTSILLFFIVLIYDQFKFGSSERLIDCLISWFVGALFATGLIVSGLVNRRVVLEFFVINKNWNPSLGLVFAFAVLPNILTFYLIQKEDKPLLATKFCIPTNQLIDLQLITGAILFGIGWGIGGICPGPVFCMLSSMFSEIIFVFFVTFVLGMLVVNLYLDAIKKGGQQK